MPQVLMFSNLAAFFERFPKCSLRVQQLAHAFMRDTPGGIIRAVEVQDGGETRLFLNLDTNAPLSLGEAPVL